MAAPMTRHDFLLDGEEMTTASCSGFPPLLAPAQRMKVAGSIFAMRSTPLPTVRAYEIVASDSICVDHLVAQPTGDDVGKGLAELKIEEGTSVKLSGEGLPVPVYWFEKSGLVEKVVQNMFMSGFKFPTPVQRYSIPMALAGRDLLVCAQKGSGKVAALCIPVASMLLSRTPAAGGQHGSPRALLLVPNDRIAEEIVQDTRELVYETGIRVVHSRKNQNFQIHELEAGVDIFVSTPGHLVDLLISNQITLEAIEYLVICDIGRLLDLGCETKLREIFDQAYIGKPPRQTLLSSDTFEPEVQNFARNILSDYLLITDGILEFNIGLTSQNIELVSEGEKRVFLLKVLQKQSFHCAGRVHQSATLVFVETKEKAVSLSNWLNNESSCSTVSTVIFGDCSEQEMSSALASVMYCFNPILIAGDATSLVDLDVGSFTYVINYDLPKSIEEYIERIRKFRRARRVGSITSFFTESNQYMAKGLWELMIEIKLEVPSWLVNYADPDYSCRFKELELQDEEYEKYRHDLAGSLLSRKINTIYDLVDVYAELNCKNKKKSSLEDDIKRICRDCCIAFEQQEEHKLLKFMFVKLLQHSFIPEKYGKSYRHYNFIAKIKEDESGIWTEGTYFAESKLEGGVQQYFCCLLEQFDKGECYGCQNEKAVIKHPTTGDYQRGTPDYVWPFNYGAEISDSDDAEISDSDDDLMDLYD